MAEPPPAPAPPAQEVFLLPASWAQERLWFLDRYAAARALFNIPSAFRVEGPLDPAALAAAFVEVARRHEALRTTFEQGADGGLLQVVAPPPCPLVAGAKAVPEVDLAALPAARAEAETVRLARREAATPFDLAVGPLWRLALLRLAAGGHVLLLDLHHIVADGWSLGLLLREVGALYAAALAGRPSPLPEPPLQYADFAAWQREELAGEALTAKLAPWRSWLAGAPRLVELPMAAARPAVQSHRGARRDAAIPAATVAAVEALARRGDDTPFRVYFAAFQALLGRITGQDDLVVGTAVANRRPREVEGVVGFFANTLPLRADLAGDPTFAELVARVRERTLAAFAHQDVPFERLVDELAVERNPAHNPLIQVIFLLEDEGHLTLELAGAACRALDVDPGTSKYDLSLTLSPRRGGTTLARAIYARDLFTASAVDRLLGSYRELLAAAVTDPVRRISELPLLSAAARHQLLVEWNDTASPAPAAACLHHLFEARAAGDPEAPAIEAAGGTWSYARLNRRANRLAHRLRALGVGPGALVGVHLARTPWMAAAVLAVGKAGGAYVPLEADWPLERLRWIVARHGVAWMLTDADHAAAVAPLAANGLRHLLVVDRPEEVAAEPATDPPPRASAAGAADVAYIIFTSGSTGRPKGVVVRQRAAVNLVDWVNRTFAVGPGDRLLFVTALSFDLSVYDLFGILAAGATVVVAGDEERHDPEALVARLCDGGITFWDSAPAALQQCAGAFPTPGGGASARSRLRLVFLSGDWIPVPLPDRIRAAFPAARVVALGGATEATVWSNVYPVGVVDPRWPSIPYGRPIAYARYHVLDARFAPAPVGVPGDLYIGGVCLSDGYAGEPRRTAEQYRPDPFTAAAGGRPGGRLYRTGDRARYLPDGNLEFLGRRDTQVKLRGYRVELGEIEAVLAEHPGVAEAVAVVREDAPGDQRLVAYLLGRVGSPPEAGELRRFAADRLPGYMVPAAFVEVERWPLAATGKLDRKALPAPGGVGAAAPAAGHGTAVDAAPREGLEAVVAGIWRRALRVERVGRDDNFFDLGGHSLLLAQVHGKLEEALVRRIPMVELFRHPTVAELAERLETPAAGDAGAATDVAPAAAAVRPAPATAGGAVAVVGMAGRFPGAPDLGAFWRLVRDGVEGVRSFSDEELAAAGVPAERRADPRLVRARGALADADRFDAALFGLSPREAQITDPQQRQFLEVAWAALEDAGYDPRRFAGRVGVFAGVSDNGYGGCLLADPRWAETVGRFAIKLANQADYVATRASYKLDLRGPGLTVQTACSTSLVAIHLACRALTAGDCELALAGGASVQPREVDGYLAVDGGIDSPDGHTRAFDAGARGVVGGSGVGVVVLKRLADALADGDAVRAVVAGSAVNNDGGGKVGFTAPSEEGQARVIADALAAAGVGRDEIESVRYVEAHGTATPLGDPIEVAGLTRAFRPLTARRGFCALGSVKTNVGHLDAAAGVAGFVKAVLALEHGEIPPSLHYRAPNPEIDFAAGPFYVAARAEPWPEDGRPRRAGVSSFGIGGTNAHVVLAEAPAAAPSGEARPVQLLAVSARTPTALAAACDRLADHLEGGAEGPGGDPRSLADVAYTLAVGRRQLQHRRAIVGRSHGEAAARLRRPARAERRTAAARGAEPTPVAFLLPGQGAQFAGMASELYAAEPVFRQALDRCAERLAPELGLDLAALLFPPVGAVSDGDGDGVGEGGGAAAAEARLAATAVAQPALFAVELALAELWRSWGVEPAALLGHSLGELTAACLAGVFTLDEGLALVAARGRLMAGLPAGEMAAVDLSAEAVAAEIAGEPALALAAVNGPDATVVAGEPAAVAALAARLAPRGVSVRPLATAHAFHSPAVDAILAPFRELVSRLTLRPPRVPLVSNVTGGWLTAEEATDPDYWVRQMRRPVRFDHGLTTLLGERAVALLEVGPGRTLTALARRHPAGKRAAAVVPSLAHRGDREGDEARLLAAAGGLWCAGAAVALEALFTGQRRRRVPLPTYPFEGRRYTSEWGAATTSAEGAGVEPGAPAHGAPAAAATPGGPDAGGEALDPVEREVAEVWEALLGVAGVGRADDFFELGGSSLLGLRLNAEVKRRLGVELPATVLLEAPTLGELAARVAAVAGGGGGAGEAAAAPSCLVRLQPGAAGRRPLFLVHQVGGHVFTFRALARALGPEAPVYGLRSRGLEAGEEPLATVEEMAAHYLERVRETAPRGPYLLGGASMGGMVAFEMAHRLVAAGERVALLALMDTPCGDQMPRRDDNAEPAYLVVRDRTGLTLDHDALRRLPPEERFEAAVAEVERAGLGDRFDVAEARRLTAVLATNIDALYRYRPVPYPGAVLFFRAATRRSADPPRPELPWIELAGGGAETVVVPGDHESMHQPPQVAAMAARLRTALELLARPGLADLLAWPR